MGYLNIFGCLAIFLAGFISCALLSLVSSDIETPISLGTISLVPALNSPGDWIKESGIHVYENAIVIDI